jgi:hypothetical protein
VLRWIHWADIRLISVVVFLTESQRQNTAEFDAELVDCALRIVKNCSHRMGLVIPADGSEADHPVDRVDSLLTWSGLEKLADLFSISHCSLQDWFSLRTPLSQRHAIRVMLDSLCTSLFAELRIFGVAGTVHDVSTWRELAVQFCSTPGTSLRFCTGERLDEPNQLQSGRKRRRAAASASVRVSNALEQSENSEKESTDSEAAASDSAESLDSDDDGISEDGYDSFVRVSNQPRIQVRSR